jgi:hypothetical protein
MSFTIKELSKMSLKLNLLIVFASCFFASHAAVETYSSRIQGNEGLNAITQGLTYQVSEGHYNYMSSISPQGWQNEFVNKSVNAFIELGWDESLTKANILPYEYEITFEITKYTIGGATVGTPLNQTLRIAYDNDSPMNKSKAIFRIDGYHKLGIRITNIKDLITPANTVTVGQENMYVETRFEVERYYAFRETRQHRSNQLGHLPILHPSAAANGPDELKIHWSYLAGAEAYELEWTYINNYEEGVTLNNNARLLATEIPFNDRAFELNSTRIKTGFNNYTIPLIYDEGYIMYRVRGVGRDMNNPSHTIYGQWSQKNESEGKVADYSIYPVEKSHDSYKNWQYTATFAEEGKKKEVVSYFDGTLRNKQTVTKINSADHAIVGESIYDHQGRAAIQTLPVPSGSSVLGYYPNFNKNSGVGLSYPRPYSRNDFDKDGAVCAATTDSMHTNSGSSSYYSAKELLSNDKQDFVPISNGFPFTQIEYEPDNTGRIRAQSGVGKTHQLGGHDTKYFYGQPHQIELDRLFGYDVGYKKRYKKNMVIDPNGQISVSYIDPQGRTIATALVGNGPGNLDQVTDKLGKNNFEAQQPLTVDLLNKVNADAVDTPQDDNDRFSTGLITPSDDQLSFSAQELNPLEGTKYLFSYSIIPPVFTDNCVSPDYCYPVVYDLSLSMKDKCAAEYFPTEVGGTDAGPFKRQTTVGNLPNLTCKKAMPKEQYDFTTANLFPNGLEIGSYTISKKLTINKDSLAAYKKRYITDGQNKKCIKELIDFEEHYLSLMDTSCAFTCAECLEDIINTYTGLTIPEGGIDFDEQNPFTTALWTTYFTTYQTKIKNDGFSEQTWMNAYSECTKGCEPVSLCKEQYHILLADVSPGGQYAVLGNNKSVLSSNSILGVPTPWKDRSIVYLNTDQTPALVLVTETTPNSGIYSPSVSASATIQEINNFNYVTPGELSDVNDFLNIFETQWAEALVKYHPEYKYYQDCIVLSEAGGSEAFDTQLINYNFNEVIPLGLPDFNTLIAKLVTSSRIEIGDLTPLDPYFTTAAGNTSVSYDFRLPYYIFGNYQSTELTVPLFDYAQNRMLKALNEYSYHPVSGAAITMWKVATLTVDQCGRWYGIDPCNTVNTNKAEVWEQFKYMYVSEKQKIQAEIADMAAIKGSYYNINIGKEKSLYQSLLKHGFLSKILWNPTLNWQNYRGLANDFPEANYTKRYENINTQFTGTTEGQVNGVKYNLWQQTGQCPNAFNLQLLLNGMAKNNNLTNAIPLLDVPEFVPGLYEVLSGRNPNTNNYAQYTWNTTASGDDLSINLSGDSLEQNLLNCVNNAGELLKLNLVRADSSPFLTTHNWSNYGEPTGWEIESFNQLTPDATGNGFTIMAYVNDIVNTANNPIEVILTGTSCLSLGGCGKGEPNELAPDCPPSEFAEAIAYLLNRAISAQDFGVSPHTINSTATDYAFVNVINTKLGANNSGTINAPIAIEQVAGSLLKQNINAGKLQVEFDLTLAPQLASLDGIIRIEQVSVIADDLMEAQITISNGVSTSPWNTNTSTHVVQIKISDITGEPIIISNCCEKESHEQAIFTENNNLVDNGNFEQGDTLFTSDIHSFPIAIYDEQMGVYSWFRPGFIFSLNGTMEYVVSGAAEIRNCTPDLGSHARNIANSARCLCGDHTTGNGDMMIVKSEIIHSSTNDDDLLNVWSQGGIAVEQHTTYEFSAWILDYGVVGSTHFSLEINNPLTTQEQNYYDALEAAGRLFKSTSSLDKESCGWQKIAVTWNSGTNTIANLQLVKYSGFLETGLNTGASTTSMYNFAIDDISLIKVEGSCEDCIPYVLTPVDCYTKYDKYINFIADKTAYTKNVEDSLQDDVYFPAYYLSQNEFCSGIYKYAVDAYMNYLTTMESLSIAAYNPYSGTPPNGSNNAYYIPFSKFTAEWMLHHVPDYLSYVSTSQDNTLKTLSQFIDEGLSAIPNSQPNYCVPYLVPHLPVAEIGPDPCVVYAKNIAMNNAKTQYENYVNELTTDFEERYIKFALDSVVETFELTHQDQEYQYTLYKFDQGNNLVQTVPPRGVNRIDDSQKLTRIKTLRAAKANEPLFLPLHSYKTDYEYNSLNQLVKQTTPDAGESNFWYDYLGRLVASQNAKQAKNKQYSYTKYDGLGRIIEVGELTSTIAPNHLYDTPTPTVDLNNPAYPYNNSWFGITAVKAVTRTYYDKASGIVMPNNILPNGQENLRNRVARTTYQDEVDYNSPNNLTAYQRATHYSYDLHGNVKELVQENKGVNLGHAFKTIGYTYDLISGNVIQVAYQKGQEDAFHHKYEYDADNRITNVWTSADEVIWVQDAKYFYYDHGPLARTEIGDDKTQGTDYAYTIQGWLKTSNGNLLDPTTEIGKDGALASTNLHANVGKDAFGFSLSYFDGDYKARGIGASNPLNNIAVNSPITAGRDLFNGNIAQMAVALSNVNNEPIPLMANNYTYDQLNRLISMRSARSISTQTGTYDWKDVAATSAYNVDLNYDPNGNILKLGRNDNIGSVMDDLKYYYYNKVGGVFDPKGDNPAAATNRLAYVTDSMITTIATDIESQAAGNYSYDAIGNLTADVSESITDIEWTVYGKIKAIHKTGGLNELEFEYDASGNRVTKIIKPNVLDPTNWKSTYYVRDASGNVMATYAYSPSHAIPGPVGGPFVSEEELKLKELNIYGSSRVAVVNEGFSLTENTTVEENFDVTIGGWHGISATLTIPTSGQMQVNTLGNGRWNAAVNFIITIPGETYTVVIDIIPSVVSGTSFEIWDANNNNLIQHPVITNSGQYSVTFIATTTISRIKVYTALSVPDLFYLNHVSIWQAPRTSSNDFSFNKGKRKFELTNHLGNVMSVVTDKKILDFSSGNVEYNADVISYSDYYPGGSLMPGRNENSSNYRYGFNKGSEKDDEITGVTGSHITTHFREYDTRLGRTWSIDPKASIMPWQSPYTSMDNNPIWFNDPLGDVVDVSHLSAGNAAASDALISDLDSQTGLIVFENNGKLDYAKNSKGKAVFTKRDLNGNRVSRSARKALIKVINSSTIVKVQDNTGSGNYVSGHSNTINFDIGEINLLQGKLSSDLDKGTFGAGLVLLHELGHTNYGGSLKDEPARVGPNDKMYYKSGTNSAKINKMRGQRGRGFGKRVSYNLFRVGGSRCMPFSRKSRRQIKRGKVPTSKVLKL